jgi:hypothetical protein
MAEGVNRHPQSFATAEPNHNTSKKSMPEGQNSGRFDAFLCPRDFFGSTILDLLVPLAPQKRQLSGDSEVLADEPCQQSFMFRM